MANRLSAGRRPSLESHSPSRSRSPAPRAVDLENGRRWVETVEDPWDPCILALDGGGIRGYSSLLILRELMCEIHTLERQFEEDLPTGDELPDINDLLPCEYFDFMYGTSTGGLISLMLGRLRMSIGDCLDMYKVVGDKLFGKRKSWIPLQTKYRHEPLEEAVRKLTTERQLGSLHPWEAGIRTRDGRSWGVEARSGREAAIGNTKQSREGADRTLHARPARETTRRSTWQANHRTDAQAHEGLGNCTEAQLERTATGPSIRRAESRQSVISHGQVSQRPSRMLFESPVSMSTNDAFEHSDTNAPDVTHEGSAHGLSNGARNHSRTGADEDGQSGLSYYDVPRADSAVSPNVSIKFSERSDINHLRFDPDEPRMCHSCCLTAVHNKDVITAHLLRSYTHYYDDELDLPYVTRYNPGADPLELWQVARATSAAPFYFDMLQVLIDNEIKNFKDGGLRENNPSGAGYDEFLSLYVNRKDSPALFLSIGTGRADNSQDGFMTTWPGPFANWSLFRQLFQGLEKFSIIPNLLVKLTESEGQHRSMLKYAKGENTWYKRLNVSTGLEKMALDNWISGNYHGSEEAIPGGQTLTTMEEATRAYLDRDFDRNFERYASPRNMLKQTAEKLVRQRRARRAMGGPRWETYIGADLKQQAPWLSSEP